MGRAEKRRLERQNRLAAHKDQITVSRQELGSIKDKVRDDTSKFNVEALMTCFALAEHRLYGHGQKRILRTLSYIDELMGGVKNDETTVDELKQKLQDETGVRIVC